MGERGGFSPKSAVGAGVHRMLAFQLYTHPNRSTESSDSNRRLRHRSRRNQSKLASHAANALIAHDMGRQGWGVNLLPVAGLGGCLQLRDGGVSAFGLRQRCDVFSKGIPLDPCAASLIAASR